MRKNTTRIKLFKIENGEDGLQKAESEINDFFATLPADNCWPMIQLYSGKAIVIYQDNTINEGVYL
jgi:hypothetical protein